MNFAALVMFFLVSLVSQSPLITGLKSERSIASESRSILDGTKLIMNLESGDTVVRRPRGSDDPQEEIQAPVESTAAKSVGGASGEKRSKNGNKKLSRNQDVNAPVGGRNKHHMDKKLFNSDEQLLQQQQQQQQHHQHNGKRQQSGSRQQHGSLKSNKQRQLLKSQQHQERQGHHQGGKRNKATSENGEHGSEGSKPHCQYRKSAWSECDSRTNAHSRTLTLRSGDSNCPATRTVHKKCKKACRYEKGTWSECKENQMTRVDKLKIPPTGTSTASTTDSSCEAERTINKKCNPERNSGKSSKSHQNGNGKSEKKERKNKEKANNRGTEQA